MGTKREWERKEKEWETEHGWERIVGSVINLTVRQVSKSLEKDNPRS